jgi:serine/threonine-protein kinase
MADEPRVQKLLDEIFDADRTPEEVCGECPELLPEVRRRWGQMRTVNAELEALFPTPGPTPTPDTPPPWYSGADLPRIPGYELEAVLGHGGMGVVYKARDLRLSRPVALKMLLAGAYAGPAERERFLREAEAVAGLRHANIVQVHGAGDHDGRPYFTMEYVEGGSLAQRLAGTPQPARQAAALVATLAEAVHVAHQGGIVHRDLKPANILLMEDGTPKIADFGLARRLEGGAGLTQSGVPLGTPSYMAPEQARGQTRAIGPAVDVYALGAILYELLTGRPPFRAETPAETLLQVISQEPVPPVRLNAKVPRDLDTICSKCLQKDPKKRYASAGELADDLGRYLRHEPILARPVGPGQRALRWMRRHVGLTAALAGMGFLLVLLFAGALWSAAHFRDMEREERGLAEAKGQLADENDKERQKAVEAQKRETVLRGQAEKQAQELRQNLYFAGMNLAGQAGEVPQRDRTGQPVVGSLGKRRAGPARLGVVLPQGTVPSRPADAPGSRRWSAGVGVGQRRPARVGRVGPDHSPLGHGRGTGGPPVRRSWWRRHVPGVESRRQAPGLGRRGRDGRIGGRRHRRGTPHLPWTHQTGDLGGPES